MFWWSACEVLLENECINRENWHWVFASLRNFVLHPMIYYLCLSRWKFVTLKFACFYILLLMPKATSLKVLGNQFDRNKKVVIHSCHCAFDTYLDCLSNSFSTDSIFPTFFLDQFFHLMGIIEVLLQMHSFLQLFNIFMLFLNGTKYDGRMTTSK